MEKNSSIAHRSEMGMNNTAYLLHIRVCVGSSTWEPEDLFGPPHADEVSKYMAQLVLETPIKIEEADTESKEDDCKVRVVLSNH